MFYDVDSEIHFIVCIQKPGEVFLQINILNLRIPVELVR